MNWHPIPFSVPMVRAILEGRKTQTRRVMTPQPSEEYGVIQVGTYHPRQVDRRGEEYPGDPIFGAFTPDGEYGWPCPYGAPDDMLWVREKTRVIEVKHGRDCTDEGFCSVRLRYEADGTELWVQWPDRDVADPVEGQCIAYGGLRETSRINLRITDVRIERVQDISEEDAIAEGIKPEWRDVDGRVIYGANDGIGFGLKGQAFSASDAYKHLWDSINAKRGLGWKANPWVWVIEFGRVQEEV